MYTLRSHGVRLPSLLAMTAWSQLVLLQNNLACVNKLKTFALKGGSPALNPSTSPLRTGLGYDATLATQENICCLY